MDQLEELSKEPKDHSGDPELGDLRPKDQRTSLKDHKIHLIEEILGPSWTCHVKTVEKKRQAS